MALNDQFEHPHNLENTMKQSKKIISRSFAFGIVLSVISSAAFAQTAASYPDKPIKVIIPFPPGGTLDKVGRMLALKVG